MAIFNDAVITNAGKNLIAKVLENKGTLQFTGIAAGTGLYTESEKSMGSIEAMAALKKTLAVFQINSIQYKGEAVILKGVIENTSFTSNQCITEIGLLAEDGQGSILYSVATAEKPLNIPAYNGSYAYSVTQEIYIAVSGGLQITVKRGENVYVLSEDFEIFQKEQEEALSKCALGEGLTFFVDNDGILNVTYDDGIEEGEEETENEADNTGGRQGDIG